MCIVQKAFFSLEESDKSDDPRTAPAWAWCRRPGPPRLCSAPWDRPEGRIPCQPLSMTESTKLHRKKRKWKALQGDFIEKGIVQTTSNRYAKNPTSKSPSIVCSPWKSMLVFLVHLADCASGHGQPPWWRCSIWG